MMVLQPSTDMPGIAAAQPIFVLWDSGLGDGQQLADAVNYVQATFVPEPSTFLLISVGASGLCCLPSHCACDADGHRGRAVGKLPTLHELREVDVYRQRDRYRPWRNSATGNPRAVPFRTSDSSAIRLTPGRRIMADLKRRDAMNSSYSVPWARSLLKGIGLRSTASRIAVLQQLAAASKPLNQSEVFEKLRDFGFNRWTVFRSFSDFTEAGWTLRLGFSDQGRPRRQDEINAASKIPWATNLLKSVGLRSTAARIAVLQQLAAASKPLSHSEVLEKLRDFGFDRTTIFRALGDLTEAGVTSKLDLGDLVRRFELRSTPDGVSMKHPHFMCVDCGQVWCLNDFAVRLKPSYLDRSRIGEITEVLLRGHCAACHTGKSSHSD